MFARPFAGSWITASGSTRRRRTSRSTTSSNSRKSRLRPKTDPHDRGIKIRHAIKFFQKGHKVQFTMVFRGRERFRREVAFEVFKSIVEEFGQRVKVERPPAMDGRHMVMILSGVKDAFKDVDTRDVPDELPPDAADDASDTADVAEAAETAQRPAASPTPAPVAGPLAPPPARPPAPEPVAARAVGES